MSGDSEAAIGAKQELAVDLKLELHAISQRIVVTGASNAEGINEVAKALDVVDQTLLDKRADYFNRHKNRYRAAQQAGLKGPQSDEV